MSKRKYWCIRRRSVRKPGRPRRFRQKRIYEREERIAAEIRHMDDDRFRALQNPDWGPVPPPHWTHSFRIKLPPDTPPLDPAPRATETYLQGPYLQATRPLSCPACGHGVVYKMGFDRAGNATYSAEDLFSARARNLCEACHHEWPSSADASSAGTEEGAQ